MTRLLPLTRFLIFWAFTLAACASAHPALIPWFNEEVYISEVSLPEGVTAQVRTQALVDMTIDEIYIANESATPLYLAGRTSPDTTPLPTPALEPKPPISPAFKIVSGAAYEWTLLIENTPIVFDWEEISIGSDDPNGLRCHIWGQSLRCEDVSVLQLKPLNHYDYGGERPENVEIPEPQNADLELYYGNLPVHIPLEIRYSLNTAYPDYGPGIDPMELGPAVALICLFSLVTLVLWVIIKASSPKRTA